MSTFLAIGSNELEQRKGYWTAREIAQQPSIWRQTANIVKQLQPQLNIWLQPLLALPELRVILTGAGTSAYVGASLAPYLSATLQRNIEAIATTDLVTNPEQYFAQQTPTLLISYARSGNSPESVAAVELADQLLDDCYHLVISCNKNGKLATMPQQQQRCFALLMPDATLDQSFAMTSSFTSMMLATLCLFCPDDEQLNTSIAITQQLIDHQLEEIKKLAQLPFKRAVYLGSGGLTGVAKEAALKMLELSAGQIDCYHETPLGFRHGPKSIVNADTLVVLLSSHFGYRKQYENDLFQELTNDKKTEHVYVLTKLLQLDQGCLTDVWLSFPYIVYCQALAFYKALALRVTPDDPCPSGEVNRVVQGVNIYPYESN